MENKTSINFYPGHMPKTKRLIKENINLIDIVYEVIDARVPYSSKIKHIETTILNKPKILIMTKTDLCDKKETQKWKKYYEESFGYSVIMLDLKKMKGNDLIINKTNNLLSKLDKKREQQGLKKRKYRALVVGIPNVGKSTLVNNLAGKKVALVGNKPGVTTSLNWIRINSNIEILDTPGILWPKFDEKKVAYNLASTTAIKEEVLNLEEISYYILKFLNDYYPILLKKHYKLEKINKLSYSEIYETIGKLRGCYITGGEIDYERVAALIINDLKDGKIKGITFDRYE